MEAPEKIYLVEDRQKHEPMEYWYNSTTDDSKIEYTRTDAFIEKAEKFINTVNEYLYYCISEGCELVDIDKFIKDFKNYMEG